MADVLPESLRTCKAHVGSQGLASMRTYAQKRLEDWRDELEQAAPERVQKLQGMIAGVRELLGDIWGS